MAEGTLDVEKKRNPNRLIGEKSPYLLQHAHNPVNWYPWGPEAFDRAARENKPVFLSIGYSTCHWCHVMERESFEDDSVAALLNDSYVAIKVDREERPDIDGIYMTVCQMMTGSGGWPLTIIMTPDRKPFFAGTYFPRESRWGRVGMLELLPRIRELWTSQQGEAARSADQITRLLRRATHDQPGTDLDEGALRRAFTELDAQFDPVHGGFGQAPKFPTPHHLLFLLRFWHRSRESQALTMVERSLQALRQGGIYDHIGYGFHRYSTDVEWLVPHFEKMLYDQALLAMAYTEAYQATGNGEYRKTAREIFTYVLRDMTAPGGGFYSAEDADSEGEEGKFYLWTESELGRILDPEEATLVAKVLSIERERNFTGQGTGNSLGTNIPHRRASSESLAHELGIPVAILKQRFDSARTKMLAARARRVHPLRDDKVLGDWNGLMIAALAKGAQGLGDVGWAEAARAATGFVLEHMRAPKGRLWHRYREGQVGIVGNLDDYAFMIWGLIELYEATFEIRCLRTALELNQVLMEDFWDGQNGGFFFSPVGGEDLLVRQKPVHDGAIPSGNSVAMLNLLRLGRITTNPHLDEMAHRSGRAFSEDVKRSPAGHTYFMVAQDYALGPSHEVVIAGDPQSKDTEAMLKALRSRYLPNTTVLLRPGTLELPEISILAPFTKPLLSLGGKATAYVCTGSACQAPTTDPQEVLKLLDIRETSTLNAGRDVPGIEDAP